MMKRISSFILAIVIGYFIFCYGEILIKNTHENPSYSNYNLLTNLIQN